MDILGIIGSCRKSGNTDLLVRKALEGAEAQGFRTRAVMLSDYAIADCTGCEGCRHGLRCVVDDGMQELYPLLEQARGLVIGSPTYFYNVSGIMKNFLDRLYCQEFFNSENRSVWLGLHEVAGIKYAVTVAVCEQERVEDMGFTSEALARSLAAVGYRVVDRVEALHAFARGEVRNRSGILDKARLAGERLALTLNLHNRVKGMLETAQNRTPGAKKKDPAKKA